MYFFMISYRRFHNPFLSINTFSFFSIRNLNISVPELFPDGKNSFTVGPRESLHIGRLWVRRGIFCVGSWGGRGKGVSLRSKGISLRGKGVSLRHGGIFWRDRGIFWRSNGRSLSNKGVFWTTKGKFLRGWGIFWRGKRSVLLFVRVWFFSLVFGNAFFLKWVRFYQLVDVANEIVFVAVWVLLFGFFRWLYFLWVLISLNRWGRLV